MATRFAEMIVPRPPLARRLADVWHAGGGEPALFALKCFAASMLAFWVALEIGLTRPYWAVTTSWIVANPLSGAVLSKAVFRLGGTALGAAAAVVLVPSFVNAPYALGLALALWLGACLYLAQLDRTPRAYVFLLAGYTASIIGFPAVDAPGSIFDTAILRVEEITIGILSGSFVHGLVLPRSVTGVLLGRIERMMADAERWSADSLGGEGGEVLARDRRRLAVDLGDLHMLSTHLPFDTARLLPRVRAVRALQDQLSFILPLASAIEDRLLELRRAGGLDGQIADLLGRVQAWLAGGCDTDPDALIAEARALEPPVAPPLDWATAIRLSLLARLGDLLGAHRDARALAAQIRSPSPRALSPAVERLVAAARNRPLHRDRGLALRAAAGSIATVLLGCAFWIESGWADGAGAVLIAGVCCALFASTDTPRPAVMRFLWGTILGVAVAAVYAYAIMPSVTDFVSLAAVIAPTALVLGALMGQPRTSFVTLGAVLGVFNSMGLSARYAGDFASFLNGSLAQVLGTFFAAVTVGIFQTVGSEGSAERLVRAGWRDLARRSNRPGPPDALGWTSRMLDRIGLLAPRLQARGVDPGQPLLDALVDLRVGIVVGELRTLRLDASPDEAAVITDVLDGVARFYAGLSYRAPTPPPASLLTSLDAALGRLAYLEPIERRRAAVLAVVSLRRNLFPALRGGHEEVQA